MRTTDPAFPHPIRPYMLYPSTSEMSKQTLFGSIVLEASAIIKFQSSPVDDLKRVKRLFPKDWKLAKSVIPSPYLM